VYACKDGRVAVAALEPHFASALCKVAGVSAEQGAAMFDAATREAIASFMASHSCDELESLADAHDLPLHAMKE
jgi:crotonobetainyl-CoA:carnitine CoA-transferase CaiB-like acyl-CoA transferase